MDQLNPPDDAGGEEGEAGEEAEEEEAEEEGGKFAEMMVDVSDFMIHNGVKLINKASMDDVFILDKFETTEVRSNLFLQSCIPIIKEFLYVVRVRPNDLRGPYMKGFEDLLVKMLYFTIKTDNTDPFTCEGEHIKQNQKYYRELKVIDLLVDILIYVFEGPTAPYDLQKITQKSPITRICQLIYRILKMCAKDNEINKFYVAQWISHFFDQSMNTMDENNIMSEATIVELLNDNKSLLDKQINTATLRNIVQICSDNPKSERFITLLCSLCSCNGEAILSNQDDICELLLNQDDFQHLLIKIEKRGHSYCPIFNDGEVLERNNDQPFAIDIDIMYDSYSEKGEMRLYGYFENIINLASLMCLSRNYAGINQMVNIYTIDFVMHAFLSPKVKDKFRSYFGRLLLSLHIDKDPLEAINVPELTRKWAVVQKAQVQILSSRIKIKGELAKLKDFAIQFFIDMHGTQRAFEEHKNMLTMEVLNIVEKMIHLGFYLNEKEILLVSEPIISLLDGSNDFTSKEEEEAFHVMVKKYEDEKAMRELKGVGKDQPWDNKIVREKEKRYRNSAENKMIVQIKLKIVQILAKLMQFQNDLRLSSFLIEFDKSDKKLVQDPQMAGPELNYLEALNLGTEYDPPSEQEG